MKCKYCGKKTGKCKYDTGYKKYCNFRCRTRYNAWKTWRKNRCNPAFKKDKYDRLKAWIENNREHFRDLVREPNRIRARMRFHKFSRLGLCHTCGSKREDKMKKSCLKCLIKRRKYDGFRRLKFKGLKGGKMKDDRQR